MNTSIHKKKRLTHFSVVLNGEIVGTKFLQRKYLFSLQICDIMGLAQMPSSGRKVAREA